MDSCYEKQNEEQAVIVQIETEKALGNLTGIAAVEGVGSLFVGPWDLLHSLDGPERVDRKKLLEEKISEVLSKCRASDIPAGIFAWDGFEANKRIKQGFDYVALAGDVVFLDQGAERGLAEIER